MPLITLQDAELAYGLTPLIDRANFSAQPNERIGLIGRNGTGKSSLLKILAGMQQLDDGVCARDDGIRIVLVEQESAPPEAKTLRESLALAANFEGLHDVCRQHSKDLCGLTHKCGDTKKRVKGVWNESLLLNLSLKKW